MSFCNSYVVRKTLRFKKGAMGILFFLRVPRRVFLVSSVTDLGSPRSLLIPSHIHDSRLLIKGKYFKS